MTESTCRSCHATGEHHTPLVRDATGDEMSLCPSCLRGATRLQADARDAHGRRRLAEHAETNGLQVWSAPFVAYALHPAVHVEAPPPEAALLRSRVSPDSDDERLEHLTVSSA